MRVCWVEWTAMAGCSIRNGSTQLIYGCRCGPFLVSVYRQIVAIIGRFFGRAAFVWEESPGSVEHIYMGVYRELVLECTWFALSRVIV